MNLADFIFTQGARKFLLDSNLWYEVPGLDNDHLFWCNNDGYYGLRIALFIHLSTELIPINTGPIVANLICNDLMAAMNSKEIEAELPDPHNVGHLANLLYLKLINSSQGKTVMSEMIKDVNMIRPQRTPIEIVLELGLTQSTDDEIVTWVEQSITNNVKAVAEYKSGKTSAINSIIGGVMKLSKGKANPQMVKDLIVQKLT